MTAADVFHDLLRAGIVVWREGARIRYRAPPGALTAELRDSIAAERDGLLPLLPEAPDRVGRLTGEQIEDFRSYGVEVRFGLKSGQEFWLVPAYTGRDRVEITPEDMERLATVMEAFPGAEVEGWEWHVSHEVRSKTIALRGSP